jgi:hypothetical protein
MQTLVLLEPVHLSNNGDLDKGVYFRLSDTNNSISKVNSMGWI